MKINGKKLDTPNEEILVLTRNGEDLVIRARAVVEMKEFEKVCPEPKPTTKIVRGKGKVTDFESKPYQANMEAWGRKKMDWIILKSLSATEGLEWETIDFDNPDTWNNWEQELRDSGFSEFEVARIRVLAMNANSINEARLEEARERFLRGPLEEQEV